MAPYWNVQAIQSLMYFSSNRSESCKWLIFEQQKCPIISCAHQNKAKPPNSNKKVHWKPWTTMVISTPFYHMLELHKEPTRMKKESSSAEEVNSSRCGRVCVLSRFRSCALHAAATAPNDAAFFNPLSLSSLLFLVRNVSIPLFLFVNCPDANLLQTSHGWTAEWLW